MIFLFFVCNFLQHFDAIDLALKRQFNLEVLLLWLSKVFLYGTLQMWLVVWNAQRNELIKQKLMCTLYSVQ